MIKLLISLALIILSTVLGYFLSSAKRKRKAVFAEFYEFNEKLILNLKYGRKPLTAIIPEYKFVSAALKGDMPLAGSDGEFIRNYVSVIGSTDAGSQIDYLNERKENLKKLAEESSADYKKYGSLYLKICLMAGILIAVLLA